MCATFTKAEERERERERDDEKRMLAILSRSLCSSFLRLFFSRVHRALFEETLKLFCGDVSSFFFLLWSRFLNKIFLESV